MISKRLALITICITFCLLLLGGVVHNTESSLACPDWPLCYGQVFPKMEGSILIEHGHRLLATLVGMLTIGLVFFTFREKSKYPHLKAQANFKLAVVALVLVILQGVLGGLTVIYKLPTIVSTSHLGLSMIFFSTLVLLHHRLTQVDDLAFLTDPDLRARTEKSYRPELRVGVLAATTFVYLQILLGAFMRHSGAGVACGVGFERSLLCFDTDQWALTFWPVLPIAELHMTHRYFAVVVALIILYAVARLLRSPLNQTMVNAKWLRQVKALGLIVIAVLVAQIVLGVLTVTYALAPIPTTAHLGGAALLLACLWKLNLLLKDLEDHIFRDGAYTFLGDVLGLTKPKLSGLVMVTVFAGMLLAPGHVNFFKAIWVLLLVAMVVMGAGSLNCLIEKDIDAKMVRTQKRSLPAGRLPPVVALVFGTTLVLMSIPVLMTTINVTTGILALLAFVLYLFVYTPMKQKSEMAVYVGAIPGAIPPILGWTSVTGRIDPMGWALFLILLVWQLPHFLAISIFHAKDYSNAEIKVYPNLQGVEATKKYIVFFTLILLGTALLPFYWGDASEAYGVVALVLSCLFFLLSLWGLKTFKSDGEQKSWAKMYFWGSIVYLPALLCAMLFFK